MIAIAEDGQTHIGSVLKFRTGWELKGMVLHKHDIRDLARMSDHQLVATVRQLAARTDRLAYIDFSEIEKRVLANYADCAPEFGGTPTGRRKKE